MNGAINPTLPRITATAIWCGVLMLPCHSQEGAKPAMLGTMRAESILILGNSVTLHGPAEQLGWPHHCGMAASSPEKDYVHLLAAAIDARTGGHLRLSPKETQEGGIAVAPNIVNIADIFERNYSTYTDERLRGQLDLNADIVVLQLGENVVMDTFDPEAFRAGLQRLMAGLKAGSDPCIFVTSHILGANAAMDGIKREVCAEDPERRVFVDLSQFGQDPANFASAEPHYTGVIVGHPGDKGMATIADALLKAMVERGEAVEAAK